MHYLVRTLVVICSFFCMSLQPVNAQGDLYALIYNEVSAYNGNYQEADWISQAILYTSDTYGVDPILVTAVMEQESHFHLNAISPAGAIGPMQLMSETANMIGVDPYNPLDNVIGGVMYLRNQLNRFADRGEYATTDAVAAYNAGPQAVLKYGGVPPFPETQNYVLGIYNTYSRLNSQL